MRADLVNRIQSAFADVAIWAANKVDQYQVIRDDEGGVLIAIGVNEREGRRVLVPTDNELRPKLEVSRIIRASYRDIRLEQVEVHDFVQVDCLDQNLNPTFDSLLFQLIDRLFEAKQTPMQSLLEAISDWRTLLETESKRSIREKIIGIFGELHILSRLVEYGHEGAIASWLGAEGHRHDFTSSGNDLEVKTTTSINPNILRMSGTHQFREVGGTPLYLVRLGLVEHPTGDTLVESIGKLTERGIGIEWLWQQVEKVLSRDIIRSFDDLRFTVTSEMHYRVDEHFPVLQFKGTGADLPPGIVSVSYEIDLASVQPLPLEEVEMLHREIVTDGGEF